jgi:hypothetical protein
VLLKSWDQVWPLDKSLDTPSQYNAFARLIIIISALSLVLGGNTTFASMGFTAIAVSALVYKENYLTSSNNSGSCAYTPKATTSVLSQEKPSPKPVLTTVTSDNVYGNPTEYSHWTAVNQSPLGPLNHPIEGDQFIDQMYSGGEVLSPGFFFNRVPDTTLMGIQSYPLKSLEAVTRPVGGWGNAYTPSLR